MSSPTQPSPHLTSVDESAGPVDVRHARVAWFCSESGFGQLRTPDGDLVYVDQHDIRRVGFRALDQGQLVAWVPGHDAHGLVARDVRVVESSGSALAS